MADYIRARSPEHKQERMEEIMAAADELFHAVPYSDITLSLISKELGWSRANLYKYVSTKEEIFLKLHSAYNRMYLEDLATKLKGTPMQNAKFAFIWAQTTERHAGYLKYQDILISVIETNVSLDALVAFKTKFAEVVKPIVNLLMLQCSLHDKASAHDLYLSLIYQATGLYNHFNCVDLTRKALEAANLPPVEGNFIDSYAKFVSMCLENASQK